MRKLVNTVCLLTVLAGWSLVAHAVEWQAIEKMSEAQWRSISCATTIEHSAKLQTAIEFKAVVQGTLVLRFADGSIGTYVFSGNEATCRAHEKLLPAVAPPTTTEVSQREKDQSMINLAEKALTDQDISVDEIAARLAVVWSIIQRLNSNDAIATADLLAERIIATLDDRVSAYAARVLGRRGNRYWDALDKLSDAHRTYFLDSYIGDSSYALTEDRPTIAEKKSAAKQLAQLLRENAGKPFNLPLGLEPETVKFLQSVDPDHF
jgi:hypothetical protein